MDILVKIVVSNHVQMIAMIVECVSKGNVIVHEQVMAGSLAGVSSHVHRRITNLHIR